ncbi:MAG: glutamate--cysteine ligase [Candidatus Thiodiazotropha sp.]|jgi:glutamate--cysteine ligase
MTKTTSITRRLSPETLRGAKLGLEKEGLRVNREGRISALCHPLELGSALTHPNITTDFSEALLELITPPNPSASEALAALAETESFVHRQLGSEWIWPASMPCRIDSDSEIPIACYGRSDNGMMKHVYRRGLAHRYGRMMQTIAGVHFNFSFAEELWPNLLEVAGQSGDLASFTADRYMSTLRNVQRYDWLLLYLFGASPAVHNGFLDAQERLQRFDRETCYAPYATSLRMSDMGYSNRLPAGHSVFIDNNSLPAYIESLRRLVETPHSPYEAIGIRVDGKHRQLNTHLLQIENEYYTSVRPKQITHGEESPLSALHHRGIRYLELRSLDVNPFTPAGVTLEQLHFLELFLHFCLLKESPGQDAEASRTNQHNLNRTAHEGRRPGLSLIRDGREIGLREWALELLDEMLPVAELLDRATRSRDFTIALDARRASVETPALTPSARLLTTLSDKRESFVEFGLRQSSSYHHYYLSRELNNARQAYFEALGRQSLRQQWQLESESPGLFDTEGRSVESRQTCIRSGPQRCACCHG